jgi:hypothetical protein
MAVPFMCALIRCLHACPTDLHVPPPEHVLSYTTVVHVSLHGC